MTVCHCLSIHLETDDLEQPWMDIYVKL